MYLYDIIGNDPYVNATGSKRTFDPKYPYRYLIYGGYAYTGPQIAGVAKDDMTRIGSYPDPYSTSNYGPSLWKFNDDVEYMPKEGVARYSPSTYGTALILQFKQPVQPNSFNLVAALAVNSWTEYTLNANTFFAMYRGPGYPNANYGSWNKGIYCLDDLYFDIKNLHGSCAYYGGMAFGYTEKDHRCKSPGQDAASRNASVIEFSF